MHSHETFYLSTSLVSFLFSDSSLNGREKSERDQGIDIVMQHKVVNTPAVVFCTDPVPPLFDAPQSLP